MTQVYGKYQQRVISIQELPGLLQSPSFTLSESVGPVGRWGKWARWDRWGKWGPVGQVGQVGPVGTEGQVGITPADW